MLTICLIRPPLILMLGPAILICFPFIRKKLFTFINKRININSFIIINVFIVILIIGLITLLINPTYYSQGILGITKMSTFDTGTLSTKIINNELINNFEMILPISLSAFLFGFPFIPNITDNTLSIIIGSYFILIVLSSFAIGFMIAYLVVSDFWKGEL